ncbi:MAG: hypothetical protein ACK4IX_11640, partial [Candidatus Sericytochromatia bacterium]
WFETSINKLTNHEYCKSIACGQKPFINIDKIKNELRSINTYNISDNYLKGLISDQPYSIKLIILRAINAYNNNDKILSKQLLLDLYYEYPDNKEISNYLSVVLWETGYIHKAIEIIEKSDLKNYFLSIYNYSKVLNELNLFIKLKGIYKENSKNENNEIKNYILNITSKTLDKKLINISEQRIKNKNNYLISIIIPILESTPLIRSFLNNLSSQSIFNQIELKVVYSNLTSIEENELKKITHEYENIELIKKVNDINLFKLLNEVIPNTTSNLISVCFPEEKPKKDAYEIIYKELEDNEEISLVYSNYSNILNPNDIREIFDWDRQNLFWKGSIETQTVWRKYLHKEYGYFDESLSFAGFYDFYLKISQTNKFKRIDIPLFEYDLNSLNLRKRLFPADTEIYFHKNSLDKNIFSENKHKKEFLNVISKYTKAKYDNVIIDRKYPLPKLELDNINKLDDYDNQNILLSNFNFFIKSVFTLNNSYLDIDEYYILAT